MNNKPEVTKLSKYNASVWSNTFDTFKVTVYFPENEYNDIVINYGFLAPYLLVFAPSDFTYEEAASFAVEKGFDALAKKYATSVVFIYPTNPNGWVDASPDIFSEILTNSKIHQYYEEGLVIANNRFTKQLDGYFIRGAIFRTQLFGYGESADYIALNCINHFEGDGLWGRADSAPVTCILNGLSKTPKIDADDIPILSIGNSDDINSVIKAKAKYSLIKDNADVASDFETFGKQFRRMLGILEVDPDLEAAGLIKEPGVITVTTSPDNSGDDKGTSKHEIGYFAFYNKDILTQKVPTLLCFHGGGDSALYIPYISGWAKIAHEHNFLLISIENHINSTATEMVEFVNILKEKYPIDSERLYASGFSMGGCKTWDIIQEYPNMLAAAAPMDATFEIGLNVFGELMQGELNRDISVPVFYAGGEITPLPELPFQGDKCVDRMKYLFEINNITKEYVGGCTEKATEPFIFGTNTIKSVDTSDWENKIWGLNGDDRYVTTDPERNGKLTIELFKSDNGKCYSALASIDNQGHECRYHTCENAWRFMSNFRRTSDGAIEGGEFEVIKNCFTK